MIAKIAYVVESKKSATRHYVGLPAELAGPFDVQRELPQARVLLLHKPGNMSGFVLDRLAADGSDAGDTWHQNVVEAEDQAKFEYGGALSDWHDVPSTGVDVRTFAIECARRIADG